MKKFKHDKHGNSYWYIIKDEESLLVGLVFLKADNNLYYKGKYIYSIRNGVINWLKHSIRL
jgi:hypothetical protein